MTKEMPSDLNDEFEELHNDIVWLHVKWQAFRQLYSQKETVQTLNSTAANFFWMCQRMLTDEVLLSICRLTDPAQTGRFANRSLARLVSLMDEPELIDLKDEATSRLATIEPLLELPREHRNKRIAHTDVAAALDRKAGVFPTISRNQIDEILEAIAELMNHVIGHFRSEHIAYADPIVKDGADALIFWLNIGLEKDREERRAMGAESQ